MENFSPNRLVTLGTIIIGMLIAVASGYRIEISNGGITFEKNVASPAEIGRKV